MQTSILIRCVPDDGNEDSNLAEKDSDKERGPGWVGGGGQDEGHPGGEGEHGGGEVVHPQILPGVSGQCDL